jgi:predicted RNase H-like nuclease (RuvC/YqgF family)
MNELNEMNDVLFSSNASQDEQIKIFTAENKGLREEISTLKSIVIDLNKSYKEDMKEMEERFKTGFERRIATLEQQFSNLMTNPEARNS